jgi:hypothetical protein
MNPINIKLFRSIRKDAKTLKRPYADARLDELLAIINPAKFETSYLGFGHVKDSHYHYIYSDTDTEAVLTIKSTKENKEPDYVFTHFSIKDGNLVDLIGFYGTSIPQKEAKFKWLMGEVKRTYNDQGRKQEQWLIQGLLGDFAGARNDFQEN